MNHKKLIYLLVITTIFININAVQAQVKAWGRNDYGQSVNGNLNNQPMPITVQMKNVTGIGGGYYHTLFLSADGTILASGLNSYGQLGDGTNQQPETFVQVTGISGAAQAAGGGFHSLALLTDGTVRSWGYNFYGQLGNNNISDSSTPVTVAGMDNVIAVAAGLEHSLALRSDGTVWSWGNNTNGQLGNDSQMQRDTPVQVLTAPNTPLTEIIAVSAGEFHSIALKSDGTVFVWGNNGHGQLGNDSTEPSSVLTAVRNNSLSRVVQIAAGAYHNAAMKDDGSVFVWGRNTEGEAGNGSSGANGLIYHLTPTRSEIGGKVIDIRAGGFHTLARKADGSIFAWGSNSYGQIGDGSINDTNCSCKATPVQSAVGTGNAVFGAGGFHNFAINPQIRTKVGSGTIFQGDNVRITFGDVTGAGMTAYTAISPPKISLMMSVRRTITDNFPAYNLTTTAKTSDLIEICLNIPNVSDPAQFSRLRLLHDENGELVDRTSSIFYQKRQICARTNSLSSFIVGLEPIKRKRVKVFIDN